MIAKIAVSAAVFAIDKPYDYRVPDGMVLRPGMRVRVPFGRGNRPSEGVVLALTQGQKTELKPIAAVLDEAPVLDDRELHLAAFLRERYFCTFYDAIKAILPAGIWFMERSRYSIVPEMQWEAMLSRRPDALAVMQAIAALGGSADKQTLQKQFSEETLEESLRWLMHKKLLTCDTAHRRRVRDKTERIVSLYVTAEEAMSYAQSKRRSAPLQYAVLEMLSALGECAAKELCYFTGATAAVLNRLETLGYLTSRQQEELRCAKPAAEASAGPLVLNDEQQRACDGLVAQQAEEKPGVALLYGVTGSGKTSVYIALISRCLAQGRGALLLVPEIALTPQLLSLFAAHFGEKVAVLHSNLSIPERYDTWKRIKSGAAPVVIGTRSAVFAPVQSLGLLIVDEEQEHTYKSENSPRYHAREVAIYRGVQERALVLLGSATPSIESMHRAKQGVYRLYTLRSRYNRCALPPVEIVDLKQELKSGNPTAISEPLLIALRENLKNHQQSILFLNRRGTSRMIACVDCGYVPACPACSVNLTYHHANGRLMCHYCGRSEPMPTHCPVCGGHLKQIGCGTQKVQEQLAQLLPGTEVLRMDADTISAVHTHEKLLNEFRDREVPILLGTQMVTKGLNFEKVTLVGVLDADMSLYVGSYKAAETTFSMVTQVVGRAGRGETAGRAVVQTMTPENQVLVLAARQDYDAFFAAELPLRQARGCPPFRDLITVTFHGLAEEEVWQAALELRAMLAAQLASPYYQSETAVILGPAPAAVARVNYRYRCRLTLSCINTRTLRQLVAFCMREFSKQSKNRAVGVFADVNSDE